MAGTMEYAIRPTMVKSANLSAMLTTKGDPWVSVSPSLDRFLSKAPSGYK